MLGGSSTGTAGALQFPDLLFSQQDTIPDSPNQVFSGTIGSRVLFPNTTAKAALPGGLPNPKVGVRAIDPEAVRPRVYEIQAGVEQQLPGSFNLSVNYLFTRGAHLPSAEDSNIGPNFDSALCTSAVASSCGAAVTNNYILPNGTPISVPFFSQRLDARTGPIITQFSDVDSSYNGLVFTIRRPATHGFEILANYTYSKAMDDGQAGSGISGENFLSTDGVISNYDRKLEYGPSETDVPSRFTASVVYTPTYASHISNIVERKFLDGWSISSTILASMGTRYSATISSTGQQTAVFCGAVTANCTNPGYYGTNGALLATPVTLTGLDGGLSGSDIQTTGNNFGGRAPNFGRNAFELPNLYNVDLRLTKETTIRERYNIEFRLEAFNTFNSTLVQAVSSNLYSVGKGNQLTTSSTFQAPSTTSGLLLAPRQMQAGLRFEF